MLLLINSTLVVAIKGTIIGAIAGDIIVIAAIITIIVANVCEAVSFDDSMFVMILEAMTAVRRKDNSSTLSEKHKSTI